MKKIAAILLLLSFSAHAETIPQASLFFTPEEAREADRLAQKLAPAGKGDISLGAVVYYAPDDWTIWLQGQRWTPQTARADLRVLEVSGDEVRLSWRGEDGGGEREITLRPNQSYQIATGKTLSAP